MHESHVLKQEVRKEIDEFVAPCLGSNRQFITFMVKAYYIYGCSVYYIYGQIVLHLWLVDLLHFWFFYILYIYG